MTVIDEPYKHKECNRYLWTRLWPACYRCNLDHGYKECDHITRPKSHCTTRGEVKLAVQWKTHVYTKEYCSCTLHKQGCKGLLLQPHDKAYQLMIKVAIIATKSR